MFCVSKEWQKDFYHPTQMKFCLPPLGPAKDGHQTDHQSSDSGEPELPCSLLHVPRLPREPPMSMCKVCAQRLCHPLQFAAQISHLCCLAGPGVISMTPLYLSEAHYFY